MTGFITEDCSYGECGGIISHFSPGCEWIQSCSDPITLFSGVGTGMNGDGIGGIFPISCCHEVKFLGIDENLWRTTQHPFHDSSPPATVASARTV